MMDAEEIELIPANYFAPLDLPQIFSRLASLDVDLGCGDGTFLVALAERLPERNFLGIERLRGRVRSACGKAARLGLRNMRVLRVETSYAIEHLLPAQSVDTFHLLFPDPWPKKRHHRRRLVNQNFLRAIARTLIPHGRLRIATDQEDYFHSIRQLISIDFTLQDPARKAFPLTTFEKHFVGKSAPIYRLELRKTS